jgi:hypothetical protein
MQPQLAAELTPGLLEISSGPLGKDMPGPLDPLFVYAACARETDQQSGLQESCRIRRVMCPLSFAIASSNGQCMTSTAARNSTVASAVSGGGSIGTKLKRRTGRVVGWSGRGHGCRAEQLELKSSSSLKCRCISAYEKSRGKGRADGHSSLHRSLMASGLFQSYLRVLASCKRPRCGEGGS